MKKKLVLILALMLVITSITVIQPSLASISFKTQLKALTNIINLTDKNIDKDPYETVLIADEIYNVGDVIVWNENDTTFVRYVTTYGWLISETRLQIDCELYDMPQLDGDPIITEFSYGSKHESGVTEVTHEVIRNYRCNVSHPMYIAAHAVLYQEKLIGGLDYVEDNLPDQATIKAVHAYNIPPFNQSYFKTLIHDDGFLDGTYNGWCLDLDSNMIDNKIFTANVYSSYEPVPDGILEKPCNLELVNYILNQHYVGKPSSCGGEYTYGDVQKAIWYLIEDQQSETILLGPWSQCRVCKILQDAVRYGHGFIPECGQIVAIILEPVNKLDGQISIIEFTIPCEMQKIFKPAWGAGLDFSGDEWATYFKYNRTITINNH